jgi:hypothetical protein
MARSKQNGSSHSGTATLRQKPKRARARVAEPTTPQDESETKPISAMLARRLAGAASGFPNGKKTWFYSRYVRKNLAFNVSDPLVQNTPPAAHPDPAFGLFGPYLTQEEPVKRTPVARVILELTNGKKITLEAINADSVFWSASAIEKFAIPYYGAVGDLELAKKIRDTFQDPNVVAMCHGPNTEYCLQESQEFGTSNTSQFKVFEI